MPRSPNHISFKTNYINYYKRVKQLGQKPGAKVSGLISLTILTVAFFGGFAIMPTFKTIAALTREIEDTESVNSRLAKKIVSLERAEDAYLGYTDSLELMNKVLPDNNEFEKAAWQINWLANEKNLRLITSNFGEFVIVGIESDPESEIMELVIEITVEGSYGQIKEFLKEIINVDRLIVVEKVSLNNKKVQNEDKAITANIKLKASFLPSKFEAGEKEVKK